MTIKKGAAVIELKIGEKSALVNGQEKLLDTAAIIKDGRTFVPVRFISEALGAAVNWDAVKKLVQISTESGKPSGEGSLESSTGESPFKECNRERLVREIF